jgi:hypothetical protein
MEELAERAWELYDHAVANANGVVVRPSMPILYFGDSAAYARSPLKVVTAALNPSRKEFPAHAPWLRFPGGSELSACTPAAYLRSLDAYFATEPYDDWFASFDRILRGMDVSYYPGATSTALHTDICSPVATDPTWNDLDGAQTRIGDAFGLWRELIEELAPDLVLISVRWRYCLRLAPERVDTWPSVYVLERARPFHVRMRKLSIGRHRTLVAFGRAAQKPFGTVGYEDKARIGAALRRILDGE